MRQEYVRLVKNILIKNPSFKNNLSLIKKEVISIGVTENEFNQALYELSIPLEAVNTPSQNELTHPEQKSLKEKIRKMQNQPGFMRKLIEIDIVTHIAVVIIVMVPLLVWSLTMIKNSSSQAFKTSSTIVQSQQPEKSSREEHSIIPRVYASSDTVDASRVFSFPPSEVTLTITGKPKKEVYGFFPYWMLDQHEKVQIDEVTTMGLFGLEVDGGGNIITGNNEAPDLGWAMWNNPKLTELITRAKKKRIRLEITMKAFNNTNIEKLVTSDDAQKTFISNVIHLINTKSLDGVNLDFEYIGTPKDEVTEGFTRLVTNLNAELKRQIPGSTLTVDTYISGATIPGLYDVELIAEHVDALILMGYDIHTPKGNPGPVAPLDGPVSILGFLQSYLDKIPPEKIILAVPYYGYDWAVPSTGEPGRTFPYAEIAMMTKGKTVIWDEIAQTPSIKYLDPSTNTQRQLYFENTRSLGLKFDMVNKKNLKGIGIWALGYDGLNTDLTSVILDKFSN